jgi:hypothetical protein
MSGQTEYTKNIGTAIAGMVAYDFGTMDSVSYNAAAEIPFGVFCQRGVDPDDDRAIPGVTTATGITRLLGISGRSLIGNNAVNSGFPVSGNPKAVSYGIGEMAQIVAQGHVWMTATGGAIASGTTVQAVTGTGALVNTGGVVVPGATVEIGADQDGLALVRFNHIHAATNA